MRSCRPIFNAPDKSKKVTKFLNRMLAMSLRDQKLLFAYFSDTLVSPATVLMQQASSDLKMDLYMQTKP